MSEILIGNKKYDVKLNRMFIQPHIIINGITTDIGIWDDANQVERNNLLMLASKCYEYNKEKGTIKEGYFHMHQSEKIETEKLKTKKWWWF